MKVNVISRNLPHLVFLFVIPFLFIVLFPSDTFATRVDVDVNNLPNYFSGLWPTSGTLNNDSFIITRTNNSRYRTGFRIKSDIASSMNCPVNNGAIDTFSRVVYGSGWESSMFSSLGSSVVTGSYNNGIIYHFLIGPDAIAYVYENSDTSYLIPIDVNYKFESITLGCSAEEVASASPTPTPTPTPTATPTATPTSEPTPTPTPEEIDPSEYEWNPVEDAIVKYRLISFVLIAAASLLLYHIIIKRVILK